MTLGKLASGRWRCRVWHPVEKKQVPAAQIIGGQSSYATKKDARIAGERAESVLSGNGYSVTVREWWERWTTDPLFARPKESTNRHNLERTEHFVKIHGNLPMNRVDDFVVSSWLRGGSRNGQVPALRAMFNDARSAKGGRLISVNPWAELGISKTKGNALKQPPSQQVMADMLLAARELTPPSFADYLEFACTTAARPSEIDALRRDWVDLQAGDAHLKEQWSARVAKFTDPKYGPYTVAIPDSTVRMLTIARDREPGNTFEFETIRGTHYTPSSRNHHWNRVRCSIGLPDLTLYLATRHYFGWFAVNVLDMDPFDVSHLLGHKDGGKLVASLYGHPDQARARKKYRDLAREAGKVTPIRRSQGQEPA